MLDLDVVMGYLESRWNLGLRSMMVNRDVMCEGGFQIFARVDFREGGDRAKFC
ncbi:hypothetical protein Hanom_Chr05g00474941 [Helianthus anomalus]